MARQQMVYHRQPTPSQFVFSYPNIRNVSQVVLCAVKACGMALKHAGEHLQADAAIVTAAVQRNGLAFQHASEHLKADPLKTRSQI